MAVSTFLRAPWGVSLAVKSALNTRPRAVLPCHRQRSNLHGCCVARSLPPRGAASGVDEAALLLETADVETGGASSTDLREMGVSESEVLSKEAWTARAQAHRSRCVCHAASTRVCRACTVPVERKYVERIYAVFSTAARCVLASIRTRAAQSPFRQRQQQQQQQICVLSCVCEPNSYAHPSSGYSTQLNRNTT